MHKIRQVIQSYNFIAMDTEFPGVVVRPIGEFRSTVDYQYQLLRCNVDLLKIIQLGLSFMNQDGDYPPGTTTWQFNFKFNLTEDMYSQDSIDLLQNSGLQFKKHEEEGIDTLYFAELMMTSGLVLCDNVKWLSFHRLRPLPTVSEAPPPPTGTMPAALADSSQIICEVWASNVDEEMHKIRQVIQSYNFIAMDTEFPGVVVRPIGEFRSTVDYQYQLLALATWTS
ncbi:hypothetical protein CRUP_032698 [Coryphaenoides rupestris]|nr:hypothetical protein CRUP_032698 [Coryphaenoides rupestris]